jgi:cysteinyl-tRNA synthetase
LQVFIQDFILALEDDFSFSEALAVFFEFQKYFLPDIQSGELTSDEQNACVDMYLSFNQVFAILDINTFEPEEEVPEDILKILEERNIAKSQKSFEQADRLRDELFKFGYKIIDSKDGSSVERV